MQEDSIKWQEKVRTEKKEKLYPLYFNSLLKWYDGSNTSISMAYFQYTNGRKYVPYGDDELFTPGWEFFGRLEEWDKNH